LRRPFSFIAASDALQAAAGIYTMLGYDFGNHSAGYRLWANRVTDGLLRNCTGAGTAAMALNATGTATEGPETGPAESASSGSGDAEPGPYSVDSSIGGDGDGGAGLWPAASTAVTAPVSSPEGSSAVILAPDPGTASAEPSASAATRTSPLTLKGLVQLLLPSPAHGEL
jgi:hypothetical protein